MLFRLPDDDILYDALLARDASWEGRAWVGVSTTGIFCRLTCPARNPRRGNCRFYDSIAACLDAGFRPCKRCKPLEPEAGGDPVAERLVRALQADPARRWREADVAAMGLDPSTVRRSFRRQFGMTFLEMARQMRLRDGFTTLAEGGRVIDAQLEAGFASASAFRDAFARLLGVAPGRLAKDALLRATWIDTALGAMVAVADDRALHLLEFADRKALPRELQRLAAAVKGGLGLGRPAPVERLQVELEAFFAGKAGRFDVPVAMHGTAFTRTVWHALREIPVGETRSYSQIAAAIGRPTATRAVARANGANQIAIIIPCHRVIGADGTLTGYGGGLWRKRKLIDLEQGFAARRQE